MNIRIANQEEYKLVADMAHQLFEDEPSDTKLSEQEFQDRLLKCIDMGSQAYLFFEEEIVGYALVNKSRKPYYLVDFFICRPYRRGGRGTTAFHTLLKELGTEEIDLDVLCWNERGKGFWESLGFKPRAIIMRRQASEE